VNQLTRAAYIYKRIYCPRISRSSPRDDGKTTSGSYSLLLAVGHLSVDVTAVPPAMDSNDLGGKRITIPLQVTRVTYGDTRIQYPFDTPVTLLSAVYMRVLLSL